MAGEKKVARDAAEAEFQLFVEANDIDVSPEGWDADDRKSFEETKARIVHAIEVGRLALEDGGLLTFQTRDGKTLTFKRPNGAALMAMDQSKDGHNVAKMFGTMAAMSKSSAVTFSAMDIGDLKVCQAITTLFLASR